MVGDAMNVLWKIIAAGLCGSIISALVTYFVTTRNMESAMRRVTKDFMDEHLKNKHAKVVDHDEAWKVAKQAIKEHEDKCSDRVKEDINKLETKVDSIVVQQTENHTQIRTMNGVLKAIAKKMNVIAIDEGEE